MKFVTLVLFFLMVNVSCATIQEGGIHTPNFCSSTKSCAHLKFEKYPSTAEMSEFLIHVVPSVDSGKIENLTAKLWMEMGNGHGHGSAPLVVTLGEEENHFNVTNGWFVMAGTWQVVLSFKENGIDQKIIIPLDIKE